MNQANPSASPDRKRLIGYWILTALVCLPIGSGGVVDVMATPEVIEAFTHLGYPAYFARMLGIAKILGALALLAPGLRRVKEWAYAGIMIDLIAAAVSHAAVGDGVDKIAPPLVIALFAVGSYLLRPPTRRLEG